ncbi:MAG: cold shock domain-containing protein [Planctomycetes bacterium]|nr:cold shock domain-containing protein [Planctomycetota bacterium]
MRYGIVVQFFPEKGYGFIRPDRGAEIFFHITALGACQPPPLIQPGQAVKYELVPGTEPKPARRKRRMDDEPPPQPTERPRAQFVELIDRIPGGLLKETIPSGRPMHPKSRRRKPTWRRGKSEPPQAGDGEKQSEN